MTVLVEAEDSVFPCEVSRYSIALIEKLARNICCQSGVADFSTHNLRCLFIAAVWRSHLPGSLRANTAISFVPARVSKTL